MEKLMSVISIFYLCMVVAGCTTSAGMEVDAPIHYEVIVDADGVKANKTLILSYFKTWERETGLALPYSSFSVIELHPGQNTYAMLINITIPKAWGGRRNNRKAQFHANSTETIKQVIQNGPAVVLSFSPDGLLDHTTGSTKIYVIPNNLSNSWHTVKEYIVSPHNKENIQPFNLSVVCDISDSTHFLACNSNNLAAAYELFVNNALKSGGGSFMVWYVGAGRQSSSRMFFYSVSGRTPGEQMAFMLVKRGEITGLKLPKERGSSSAIVQALGLAADDLKERNGRRVALMLTDGRQVDALTGINLERRIPSPEAFVKVLEQTGQLPDLSGVEVQMYGLGSYVSNSALVDKKLEECWKELFKRCGAKQFDIYWNGISELK